VGSVADIGSGAFLAPRSEMGKKSGSGMNNPDPISESLETIFWVQILKFFDADPGWEKFGSGMEKSRIRNTGRKVQYFTKLRSQKEQQRLFETGIIYYLRKTQEFLVCLYREPLWVNFFPHPQT
jgi:hypothetical protein